MSIIIVTNIIIKSLNFFLLPLYTRYLSPSDYGIVDVLNSLETILITLFVLGLDSALFVFANEKTNKIEKEAVIAEISSLNFIIAFIPLLLIPFSGWISKLLFSNKQFAFLVRLSLFKIFFLTSITVLRNIPRLKYKYFLLAFFLLLQNILQIIFSIILIIYFHYSYLGIIYAGLASSIVISIIVISIFHKYLSFTKNFFLNHRIIEYVKFGAPILWGGIAIWIMQFSDRVILNKLQTSNDVGLYGMAIRFAAPITLIVSSAQLVLPSFIFDNKSKNDEKSKYKILSNLYFAFLSIGVIIYIPLSFILLKFMTAKNFHTAYIALPIVSFTSIWVGANYLTGIGISTSKKTYIRALISWSLAFVNIILNLILIPHFDFLGAALTTLICQIINNFISLYFSFKARAYYEKTIVNNLLIFLLVTVISIVFYWVNQFQLNLYLFIYSALMVLVILLKYRRYLTDISQKIIQFIKLKIS